MAEIRCNTRIESRDIGDFIQQGNILTFPTGEAEYSIYREADGGDNDIVFRGIEPDAVFTEFGIEDPLGNEYLPENPIVEPTTLYSPAPTELTSIGQSSYGNAVYWKCVKKQYEQQFCPGIVNIDSIINEQQLAQFVRVRVIESVAQGLANNFYNTYIDKLITEERTPYDILFTDLGGDPFAFEEGIDRSTYNQSFYTEVLSLQELDQLRICNKFRTTGIVDEGNLLQLDLSICNKEGDLPDRRRENLSVQPNTSLLDTVSSEELAFNLSKHRNTDNFRVKSNVLFRNEVIDSNFRLIGKEGERTPTRLSPDVRFRDYQIDEYNVPNQ